MLSTAHVSQIGTDDPSVYAFRILGGVSAGEMADMAEVMNAAFDRDETVRMLVLLHGFDASDAAAGLSLRSLEAQLRSLAHVERYGVLGAPSFAATMIEAFGKISPIETRTFDPGEEAAAWAFVGASPADTIAEPGRSPTNATTPSDATDEIARVAYGIWEAEGRPEGRDREHWQRARRLVEEGRAHVEYPALKSAAGGRASGTADEQSQDSAQTPSDKPGPRNPLPRPVTNTEGFVAVDGDEAAAAIPSADPTPPDAAIPPSKARRKAAGRKPVASI